VNSTNLWTINLQIKVFCSCLYFGVFLVQSLQYFVFPQWRVCYLLIDISLKDFWLLYAKAIAKTASFVFLFQYVDSVLFYILWLCPNICSLTFHFIQNNFKNIFSQDLIGWSRPANKIFRLSAPCCLFICSYICLALKGTHLMKVLLLVFELCNRKKDGKKPETLTSKRWHWSE
jgi:hypothetical protein